jgi:hypothetical protein
LLLALQELQAALELHALPNIKKSIKQSK